MKCAVASALFGLIALTVSADPAWALNGVCGAANATALPIAPGPANLCSSGSPSSVSGQGPWTWTCAGSSGGTTASCSANTANSLSINLAGIAFYSPELPFKDLAFQAKVNTNGFGGGSCAMPPVDADGYPQSIAKGCQYQWLVANGAPYPPGHYVLTYDGTGTGFLSGDVIDQQVIASGRVEFDVATPHNGIWITLSSTDPANPFRNMHVVLASDAATYQTQPFRQQFLDLLAPFKIIRFMDWSGVSLHQRVGAFTSATAPISQPDASTIVLPSSASAVDDAYTDDVATINVGSAWPRFWITRYDGKTRTLHLASPAPLGAVKGVYIENFPNRTWAQRTPLSNRRQEGPAGVAYEYMINLANTANKDIWITIPTAADDNFVTQLAKLLKNTLNPNLRIYVEYSNETWNYAYPGYNYSDAMQRKLGLVGTPTVVAADAWHPYRAVQVFQLFNKVFGEADLTAARGQNSRLVRVLTGQTAWPARLSAVVDWINAGNAAPTNGHHAYEYADAIAVTGYWSVPKSGFNPAILQYPVSQFIDQFIQLQAQAILEATASSGTNNSNYLYFYAQQAQARHLKLIQYEGGESFTVPDGDQTLVQKFYSLSRDPRMAVIYKGSLTQWQSLSRAFPGTIGNWAQFNDVGTCTQFGCWGLLDNVFQPTNASPRYQGIVNFLTDNLKATATF